MSYKPFDIPELTKDEAGKLFGGFISIEPSGVAETTDTNLICTNTNCSCPSNPVSSCGSTNSQSCSTNSNSCTTNTSGCTSNAWNCTVNVVVGCG